MWPFRSIEYFSTSETFQQFKTSVFFAISELGVFSDLSRLKQYSKTSGLEMFSGRGCLTLKHGSIYYQNCFVYVCVATEIALRVTRLIYFQENEPAQCVFCIMKESWDFVVANTKTKFIRIRLTDPYLCCAFCDCLFICLPS